MPARDLEVGRVVAVHAAHERVLARAGGREEVVRLVPAHLAALGLDLEELEAAALEDAVIRLRVLAEALVQTGLVAVERVGVLHDELADPKQPAPGPRLVPVLRLEVVPDLRKLLVRLELERVEAHRLLVAHREQEAAAAVVLELEEHSDPVAARLLPELGRREHRGEHLLAADRVHLLADDLHDLLVHAPAERQVRPEPRAHLADEASADEELVRGGLGLGRVVAHGRQKQLRRPGNHVFRIKNARRRCGAGYSTGISEASATKASLAMPLKRLRSSSAQPLNPLARNLFQWDQ